MRPWARNPSRGWRLMCLPSPLRVVAVVAEEMDPPLAAGHGGRIDVEETRLQVLGCRGEPVSVVVGWRLRVLGCRGEPVSVAVGWHLQVPGCHAVDVSAVVTCHGSIGMGHIWFHPVSSVPGGEVMYPVPRRNVALLSRPRAETFFSR